MKRHLYPELPCFQPTQLKRHILCVHENIKPFECPICKLRFKEKSKMKSHIQNLHEEKTLIQCSMCVQRFSHASSLKRHVSNVHGEKKPSEYSGQIVI